MPPQAKPGAVIYAKDLPQVSAFYAGVVGFEAAHSEAAHIVLESPLFQLVVLSIPRAIASSIEITSPPARRTDAPIKLVFFVPSLDVCREAAARLGGELNPPEREWWFQGARVCDGQDPEGNVFQLREKTG